MKKILLFLLMALSMPIPTYAQKCEKDFCPIPEVKKIKVATSVKPMIRDSLKIALPKKTSSLYYQPLFLKPSASSIYERKFSLVPLKNIEYPTWEFLHLWYLRGYIEYRYFDFYLVGQWPLPRAMGFRWGDHIYFKWH